MQGSEVTRRVVAWAERSPTEASFQALLEEVSAGGLSLEEAQAMRQALAPRLSSFEDAALTARLRGFLARVDQSAGLLGQRSDPKAPGLTHQRFVGELFGPGGPSHEDVRESSNPDFYNCYLTAPFSALARADPELLRRRIVDNRDGTYTVQFHDKKVTVDNELLVDGEGNLAGAYNTDPTQLWVSVLQKAYAQYLGSYDAVFTNPAEGGDTPRAFLQAFFGTSYRRVASAATDDKALAGIADALDEGRPVMVYDAGGWHFLAIVDVTQDDDGRVTGARVWEPIAGVEYSVGRSTLLAPENRLWSSAPLF